MNVPLASSTRSRIEASPTRPARRKSRARAGSNPLPSSSTSTRSCVRVGSHREPSPSRASACLAGVRERLLHDPVGERLEVSGGSGCSIVPANSVSHPVFGAEPPERLAERREQTALLQHRRAEPRHQPAERVGLVGELLADLAPGPRGRRRPRRP